MDDQIHPAAAGHLPFFITPPGASDTLLNVMVVIVIAVIVMLGAFYFRLHALPERMAHHKNHTQLQIVAVLCLIALFTHQHLFWIAGLLLALVHFPDFRTPVVTMAESLQRIADSYERQSPVVVAETLQEPPPAQMDGAVVPPAAPVAAPAEEGHRA